MFLCVSVSLCLCVSLCVFVCAGSWQRFEACWNFGHEAHADRWARIIKRASKQEGD